MKINVIFLLLSLLCLCWTAKAGRKKRNVLELGAVISCVTGLSTFDVLWKLDGYGCYCGLGGQGTAKDDVDDCCRLHDECYDVVMHNGDCPESTAYTTVYHYKGKDCKTPHSMISCDPVSSYDEPELANCAVDLCECDYALAQCLKGKPLNNDYRKYDKKTCKQDDLPTI